MDLFHAPPRYVIDTCSIIDLRLWYPPTMAEGVWEALGGLLDERVVVSVEEVLEELKVQEDRVAEWAQEHADAFLPIDTDLQRAAKGILREYPDLIDPKKRKSSADPFVIGAAKLFGAAVVTEEKPSLAPARPKIPNVCSRLNIEWLRVVELFGREGFHFVLSDGAASGHERNEFR